MEPKLRSRISLRSIQATKRRNRHKRRRKPGPTPDFLKAEPGSPRRSSESRAARDALPHAISQLPFSQQCLVTKLETGRS